MKESVSGEDSQIREDFNMSTDESKQEKQGKTDTFEKIFDADESFDAKRSLFFEKQKEQAQNIDERLTALLTEVYKEPNEKLNTKTKNKEETQADIENDEEPKEDPLKGLKNPLLSDTADDIFTTLKEDEGEKFRTATFGQLSSRNRKKSIRQKIITISVTLVLFLAFAFIMGSLFFRAEKIEVNGNRIYSDEIIAEYGKLKNNINLLTVSEKQIENNLTKNLPFVNHAEVKKRFPKTLILEIKECTTVFYIRLADCYVVVSDGLKVIDITDEVPNSFKKYGNIREVKIEGVERAVVSEKIKFYDADTEQRLLTVINAVEKSPLAAGINVIDVESFYDIRLTYEGRFEIMLGAMTQMGEKLDFAHKIMQKFRPGAGGKIHVENVKKGYVIPNDPDDYIGEK